MSTKRTAQSCFSALHLLAIITALTSNIPSEKDKTSKKLTWKRRRYIYGCYEAEYTTNGRGRQVPNILKWLCYLIYFKVGRTQQKALKWKEVEH